MLGRKVEHMLMGRIAQKRAALDAALQRGGAIRDVTPLGDETTNVEAPMGIEIVDHPIVPLHRGELLDDMGQMRGPIRTGTSLAEIPHELSRWNHERGQQRAHPMAHVLILALFRFP